MYRQASVLADSAAARSSYHVVSGLVSRERARRPAHTRRREKPAHHQPETARGSQGERTAEGRDDQRTEARRRFRGSTVAAQKAPVL
jgi:hypothetical protein